MAHAAFGTSKTLLTAAQMLTLNSVPIQLVPGIPNTIPQITGAYFRYFFNSIPFNPVTHDFIVIYPGVVKSTVNSGAAAPCGLQAFGCIDQTVDQSGWSNPSFSENGTGPQILPASTLVGNGIWVRQFGGVSTFPAGTDWTQGDGQLAIFLKYEFWEF